LKATTIARAGLVAAVALVAAILLTGGSKGYELKLRMDNTDGLKDGSPVTIGGVRIGTVKVDVDVHAQQAVATLEIQDRFKPIGEDTRATIVAQNVLGQKQVQLTKGSAAKPAASGFVVPGAQIVTGTDLDRVLSVLDADTRTRLAIFLNEAGTAFTGRRQDVSATLRDIATAVRNTNPTLAELAADNAQLEQLVQTGDRYVAEVTRRKADVTELIDRVGQAAVTGSTKRTQLRATLAGAPAALRTLRAFLAELRATTKPLGPAARQLSAASAPLRTALDQVDPVTKAASPALRTATSVAPTLEQLAQRATPVLKRAVPTLQAVRQTVATDLPPITKLTDRSIANVLAVVQNWAAAIQFRDGASHIFRGEASVAPDALESILRRVTPDAPAAKTGAKGKEAAKDGAPAGGSAPPPSPSAAGKPQLALPKTLKLPGLPAIPLPDVGKVVQDTLGALTGQQGTAPKPDGRAGVSALLDYLLGQ
jgi:phospholipid/cholesterol/gamma-HCH transport system substrate-binding protein